jgi:hypothetical protein
MEHAPPGAQYGPVRLPTRIQHQATVFPSLVPPLVTSRRTLSDLLGSDINRVHVTYS